MATFALLIPILLTITSPSSAKGPGLPGKEPAPINKSLLLQLVNEMRRKGCNCGGTYYASAPALTWNSQLEQAALVHSSDMYGQFVVYARLNGATPPASRPRNAPPEP